MCSDSVGRRSGSWRLGCLALDAQTAAQPGSLSRVPFRRLIHQGQKTVPDQLGTMGLTGRSYNNIVVRMIPALVPLLGSPWAVLPPGIHPAELMEVMSAFATTAWRRELFDGLVDASAKLRFAGSQIIYLDGSYVTSKPRPKDFDACWDPNGVDRTKLDPVFRQFSNGRSAQKAAFKGEFFPRR